MSTREPPEVRPQEAGPGLAHAVTETADGTTECTVFPRDCPESDLTTHWLTARADAFVSLADAR